MINKKRLLISTITGAILGIFCIIGLSTRLGFSGNESFILATWVNRVVMGFVIGSLHIPKNNNLKYILGIGALFGLILSGSFYLATGFKDTLGFFAGIIYGMIINYVATRYGR